MTLPKKWIQPHPRKGRRHHQKWRIPWPQHNKWRQSHPQDKGKLTHKMTTYLKFTQSVRHTKQRWHKHSIISETCQTGKKIICGIVLLAKTTILPCQNRKWNWYICHGLMWSKQARSCLVLLRLCTCTDWPEHFHGSQDICWHLKFKIFCKLRGIIPPPTMVEMVYSYFFSYFF